MKNLRLKTRKTNLCATTLPRVEVGEWLDAWYDVWGDTDVMPAPHVVKRAIEEFLRRACLKP